MPPLHFQMKHAPRREMYTEGLNNPVTGSSSN